MTEQLNSRNSSLQHGHSGVIQRACVHVCASDVLGAASCLGVQIHPHCRQSWRGEKGISHTQIKNRSSAVGWEQQYLLPRQPWRLGHLKALDKETEVSPLPRLTSCPWQPRSRSTPVRIVSPFFSSGD